MTGAPNHVFKFNRETLCTVQVENIPDIVNRQQVVALFNALIGEVRACEEHSGGGSGRHIDLTFHTPTDAKKALCMSGYCLSGNSLSVTALPPSNGDRVVSDRGKQDARRNLYVLNLPCDFTKPELTEFFSRCGTVSHCVILATADNASRRRGFVVMSSHEEAKSAMKILSHAEVKGYTIDVSWAVVQRSQGNYTAQNWMHVSHLLITLLKGFLDGGDRNIEVQSALTPFLSGFEHDGSELSSPNTSDRSSGSSEQDICHSSPIPQSSSTLLITNLPTLLFSQTQDLHPLFRPFGPIKKLEFIHPSPTDLRPGQASAIIEYVSASSAKDAKDTLQGQSYANFTLNVDYIKTSISPVSSGPLLPSDTRASRARNNISPLNPFAPPFVFEIPPPHFSFTPSPAQSYYHPYKPQNYEYSGSALPSGLLADVPYPSQSAPHPFSRNSYHPRASALASESRSSSTSSRLSNDSNQRPSPRVQNFASDLYLRPYDA